jgi:hypothetical protein
MVVGRPKALAEFEQRQKLFVERAPLLGRAIEQAFNRSFKSADSVDPVIFYLGHLCAEDFEEIALLVAHGYGTGAMALLRGMYERVVTARYLHENPKEADLFLDFHWVQQSKAARAIKETFGDLLPEEQVKRLDESQAQGEEVKERFRITRCKKCGDTGINHTWNKRGLTDMAKVAGNKLGDWIVPCYYEPLSYAHSTVRGFLSRLEQGKEGVRFDGGAQLGEGDKALMLAHFLLIHVLDLQSEHFSLADLAKVVEECAAAYQGIWNHAEVSANGEA